MEKRLLTTDLYDYLLRLRDLLKQRNQLALASQIEFASRFAFGSTSELYTEAESALKAVLAANPNVLSESEVADLRDKLRGIDNEFRMVGGA